MNLFNIIHVTVVIVERKSLKLIFFKFYIKLTILRDRLNKLEILSSEMLELINYKILIVELCFRSKC